jgi:branched-chain amino acid aminotransferase
MGFFASINGAVVPAEQARVSVLDTGFTFGDGVYETLRTYGGRPFELGRHLARLRASAARLGIEVPAGDGELRARLDALLERADHGESFIRLIVTRGVGDCSYHFERVQGPTVVMFARPHEAIPDRAYREGVDVAVVSVRRNHPDALDPAIKSINLLNNVLAVREAQARGAIEAILLNQRGEVAEGASSNLFVVRAGRVVTPPLDAGILAGITRDLVIELGPAAGHPVHERPLSVGELLEADEAFLTSSLKEVAPIRAVDGRPIGDGRPGPATLRLLRAYREYAPLHCE